MYVADEETQLWTVWKTIHEHINHLIESFCNESGDRPRYHIAYYTFCNIKSRYIVYLILDLVFCFSDMGVAPFCKRTKAKSFYKHLQYNKQVFKFLPRKMHAKLSIWS